MTKISYWASSDLPSNQNRNKLCKILSIDPHYSRVKLCMSCVHIQSGSPLKLFQFRAAGTKRVLVSSLKNTIKCIRNYNWSKDWNKILICTVTWIKLRKTPVSVKLGEANSEIQTVQIIKDLVRNTTKKWWPSLLLRCDEEKKWLMFFWGIEE